MSRARNYLNLVNFSRSYFKVEGGGIFETLYIAINAFHALQCRIVCEGGVRVKLAKIDSLCLCALVWYFWCSALFIKATFYLLQ